MSTSEAQAQWQLFSEMPTIGALPTAAGAARAHVRMVLPGWGVGTATIEDVEAIVSELVANAVNASTDLDGQPRYRPGGRLPLVVVRLCGDGTRIVAEVWDQAPGAPVAREITDSAESGRGLRIVAGLSDQWGWYRRGDRKCVWAEMSL